VVTGTVVVVGALVVVVVALVVVVVGLTVVAVVVVPAPVVVVPLAVVVVAAPVVVVLPAVVVVVAAAVVVVVGRIVGWHDLQLEALPLVPCHAARLSPPVAPGAVWKALWQLLLQVAGTTVPGPGEPVVWQMPQPVPACAPTAWTPVPLPRLPVVAWQLQPAHVGVASALLVTPMAMAAVAITMRTRTNNRYFFIPTSMLFFTTPASANRAEARRNPHRCIRRTRNLKPLTRPF
jgi:hypothetical protein